MKRIKRIVGGVEATVSFQQQKLVPLFHSILSQENGPGLLSKAIHQMELKWVDVLEP